MEQIKSRSWLNIILTVVLLFVLVYNRAHSLYDDENSGHNGLFLLCFVVLILACGFDWLRKNSFETILLGLFITCLPALLLFSDNLTSLLINSSQMISPLAGVILGKQIYRWTSAYNKGDIIFVLLLVPFFYALAYILSSSITIREQREASFVLCCFIPMILLMKSRGKYAILAFLMIILLFSAKRSAIIFMGVVLASLFLGSLSENRNKFKISKVIILCAIFLIFGSLIMTWLDLDKSTLFSSFDRFQTFDEEKDSERAQQYSLILLSFSQSDSFTQLFGHGSNAVSKSFIIPAHNDILEVLYDYGCIALVLFVIFWIKIIIFGIKQFKNKMILRSEAVLFCGMIIGILALTNMNCFITNPLYYILLFSFLGYYLTYANDNQQCEYD